MAISSRGEALMLDVGMSALAPIPAEAVVHGEVFTRRWIVDFVLDLAGYTADRDLADLVAVEPACGTGAFLGPMVERLSRSCHIHGRPVTSAATSLRAFDLLSRNVELSRRLVEKVLVDDGWSSEDAAALAQSWVQEGDYLLRDRDSEPVDFVLGNPPYIRLEDVPADRMAAYRAACPAMIGRSDIYVGFYEVGLRSLKAGGALGFICADRWMRNQYGRHLRELIAASYSVDATITMHDVDAFDQQVSAYPAISILRREQQGPAVVADTTRAFGPADAADLLAWVQQPESPSVVNDRFEVSRLPHWFEGSESWPTGSPATLAMIEDLNDRFPLLEDPGTGTRVGIGIATGADSVFVTTAATVEPDRLLPLSMVRDTVSGSVSWSGHCLVNPWDAGRIVDLNEYPRLRAYFEKHAVALRRRHIAVKRPANWYRTIDKVDHNLTARPKLLFPDMKTHIHPVLEEGGLYPHHNLYYIVSDEWDLRVLGGLLLSAVAEAFVAAYAVRMRGGTLRFQAQYLRRIRVPRPEAISTMDRLALADAFDRRDRKAATEAAFRIYGIGSAGVLPEG
ncbi:Eco57I restriction-modification methylase domain-containing protein [Micromonospora sp. WMMD1155]|uniref:Eco57I restriction-modification methylase domain-containing protein n=1 Tax=Micromonospora sp. WMMD1155 TaxID=3016094 RepID=UPI00249C9FE3|nr:Eco57I restriction-modification methylase domain-containing protein [Micromonospora sp. WMMD1155]WFE51469.1 Eco57I restriction-modification methylase domain-containing protein [Micromonospora sp. WMMD1155]